MLDYKFWNSKKEVVGIGLMAGTSFDGIDVAAVRFAGNELDLMHFYTYPFPPELIDKLLLLKDNRSHELEFYTRCHWTLGNVFADCVRKTMDALDGKPDFIASHGQTVYHTPDFRDGDTLFHGGSLQIGEAAVIAEKTGILTLSDFRHADIAAGGEGAPLIPWFDAAYFSHPQKYRIFLNIGGIANFTIVPPGGNIEAVVAYDTGPGNMVIDKLCDRLFSVPYDKGGYLAAQGRVEHALLHELLQDAYFAMPGPKSTGRERFGTAYSEKILAIGQKRSIQPVDLLATVTKLTSRTIADAIANEMQSCTPFEVFVSGGGLHNNTLMNMFRADLKTQSIYNFAKTGISGDAKEAVGFAALGLATLRRHKANVPSVTGAKHAVYLGKISLP